MNADREGGPDHPIDDHDPRFFAGSAPARGQRQRTLVTSQGPGASPMSPRARVLRWAIPAVFAAGIVMVAAVFYAGLDPRAGRFVAVGQESEVRDAVAQRPRRVCTEAGLPCAWLTVVEGELLALNTSGPLREEFGRLGVAWCPTSGYFGSNNLHTRYDPAGRVVDGPSPRGLDRFTLTIDASGQVVVDFASLSAGPRAGTAAIIPRRGPACDEIPFDRDADLELSPRSPADS